ncbi:cation diffusion facilitator family transporter [Sinorhizobium americanum]|uniref:Cobalt-zinc-cadmium efflux system protein n=1 Tax=Sinorhizobium americanum TaxID=194963 RepID=A0A4R2BPN2_9HYPH|nr:cation diffusion facilitator family transporter [Sinorhizobium americanum]TCN29587.1 cobalt-zinc-cadmium efflux system protein [Sinorhizobium americanum]
MPSKQNGQNHAPGHVHDHRRAGSHSDHEHFHGGLGHVHAPASFGTAFAVGIGLNSAFVAIEALFGFYANSMALLADAGHNLSDVLGLVVAWIAVLLARRLPTPKYTYGLGASSILAALANAMLLLVAVGAIAWEAVQRLWEPMAVGGMTVMFVAGIGILINGLTAYLFASGRKGDLNIRGAYMHMVADAAVSAGVVIAGLLIIQTGWTWVDPAVSLVVVAVILWGTWGLFRGSVALSLDSVPDNVDAEGVRAFLSGLQGVAEVHDLHIWPISTTETALTAHLVMPAGSPGDEFLFDVHAALRHDHNIGHSTLQVETGERACPHAPRDVV